MISLNLKGAQDFLPKGALTDDKAVRQAALDLQQNTGKGNDFTGWVKLPDNYDQNEFRRIKQAAETIRSECDALVVVGIGGSYLGARAAIELLKSPNYNLLQKTTPDIYFVGNNLSAAHLGEISALLRDKNFAVNVISKSGTTTEPAVAFRVFQSLLEHRYGDIGAKKRTFVTTDLQKGALRQMTDREGLENFHIPANVGGRYSLLTAAGLLPMAVAGIDIERVMAGAYNAMLTYADDTTMNNPTWQYAVTRQALYRAGKTVEVLACYEPGFRFMSEWWKQLYGESEGKEQGGIFPASVELTADLHSMGQYLQEGIRFLQETVITFDKFATDMPVPSAKSDWDGLDYLAGRGIESINETAMRATMEAHISGGVPNIEIKLPSMDETAFGWLTYFFQYACGLSGYIQGVNPFDQPGVEAYKKNMFRMLGKPNN